ncbi:transmembrane protein 45B-like [Limulus polyphemus]|uniref:Transmembrane protein 45B-like n=1 Tax=Limulus polyphemus TaxID=6850 RepID=A0ABM1SHF7_LIMPO|nr:transmembrane protein 45B-like [Limulus polyphemus]
MKNISDCVFLGAFFISFSLYWTLQHVLLLEARRQRGFRVRRWKFGYRAELRDQQTPSSSSKAQTETMESKGCNLRGFCLQHRRWLLEGMLKISCAVIGIAGEMFAAFPEGKFRKLEDIQHVSMYCMFVLSGIVDILCYSNIIFPKGTSNFVLALAFGVETLMFLNTETKSSLEKEVHYLMICTVILCVISTLAEMRFPTHIPLKFLRSYFTLLQGCWSVQMGFLLKSAYSSTPYLCQWISSTNKPDKVCTWVSLMFSWYVGGTFIIMSIFAAVIVLIKRKSRCWRTTSTWCNECSEEVETPSRTPDDWEEREPLHP